MSIISKLIANVLKIPEFEAKNVMARNNDDWITAATVVGIVLLIFIIGTILGGYKSPHFFDDFIYFVKIIIIILGIFTFIFVIHCILGGLEKRKYIKKECQEERERAKIAREKEERKRENEERERAKIAKIAREKREKEERERPEREKRKRKANDIFFDLQEESKNPLYGEGISYKINLIMHRLSDFATDHINLTDADLEEAQKTLKEIKRNWKKVEIEGFSQKKRDQEEAEEDRWREEREEREYTRQVEREERMERERIQDMRQQELLDIERRREKQAELDDIRRRLGSR